MSAWESRVQLGHRLQGAEPGVLLGLDLGLCALYRQGGRLLAVAAGLVTCGIPRKFWPPAALQMPEGDNKHKHTDQGQGRVGWKANPIQLVQLVQPVVSDLPGKTDQIYLISFPIL